MKDKVTVLHDLRNKMPEVRDQGPRPLCLAFAASDLNAMSNNVLHPLSVEYLAYYSYLREGHDNYDVGLTVESVIATLIHDGQPDEMFLPYDPNAKAPKELNQTAHELFYIKLDKSPGFGSIDIHIKKGLATVVCVSLPPTFGTISSPFILDKEDGHIGYHAVVIVGSGVSTCGKKFYLIRNSWGDAWGDKGHCWLSESFLSERMFALLEVNHLDESH
jgi:C1A family cysteine protease